MKKGLLLANKKVQVAHRNLLGSKTFFAGQQTRICWAAKRNLLHGRFLYAPSKCVNQNRELIFNDLQSTLPNKRIGVNGFKSESGSKFLLFSETTHQENGLKSPIRDSAHFYP